VPVSPSFGTSLALKMTSRTRVWRRNWMMIYALVLHGVWGLQLMFSEAPLRTTALGDFPIRNPYLAGLALLAVTGMAWVGVHRASDLSLRGFALVLPQQFLLMMSSFTAMTCVAHGSYWDGTVVPRAHLFADQLPSILAMLLHTGALVDWFWLTYRGQRG
jgi:hypothetical protein